MSAPLILHGYWRSSCSYRVRIVLNLKGLTYETHPVHLVRNEHLSAPYATLNPLKSVPTLEIDGISLSQSPAIIEYLEETRPTPPLLPSEAAARARVRAICAAICDIQPVGNLRVLRHVMAMQPDGATKEAREAARDAWSVKWVTAGLEGVEALLLASAGRYAVGDSFTIADAFLVPQIYNARRVGIDIVGLFPTIARVVAACEAHEAFASAHPTRQPDAE